MLYLCIHYLVSNPIDKISNEAECNSQSKKYLEAMQNLTDRFSVSEVTSENCLINFSDDSKATRE